MDIRARVVEQHATTIAMLLFLALVLGTLATSEVSLFSRVETAVSAVHGEQSAGPRR